MVHKRIKEEFTTSKRLCEAFCTSLLRLDILEIVEDDWWGWGENPLNELVLKLIKPPKGWEWDPWAETIVRKPKQIR